MQLTNKSTIQAIIATLGAPAKKSLGQNFLVDAQVLQSIIEAAELTSAETVVEVGPGLGTLTQELVRRSAKVVAVEKDDLFTDRLETALSNPANLTLLHGDILTTDLRDYVRERNYKVVANIPYYLTSPLIRYFFEQAPQPSRLVLLVQKEVAERLAAKPGQLSLLGVSAQFYASVEIIRNVPASSFWPQPKVDSAIVRLSLREQPHYSDAKLFFTVVRAGFSAKRKTLLNNLQSALKLSREEALDLLKNAKIGETLRAQELSLEDWVRLVDKWQHSSRRRGSYGKLDKVPGQARERS